MAIIYLNVEQKDADSTKALVEKEGRTCLLIPGDIRNRAFCASAVKKTLKEFGRLNILVNNAAEQHPVEDIRELDLDIMERTSDQKCPFKVAPRTNTPVTWLKSELVCKIVFRGWTNDGLMRQPVFLRLRQDKTAREVVRENVPAAAPESGA